ncbi:hypothetical protein [Candidatus Pantoea soli]|uniref:Uncharacterized protein n=1 Tax=Candidatus Pantoea soli TaxID=3098669 RepID=A0A518XIR1_9GAMM|nr:hypothetical protein [Pantoea soli]QDY44085.1 hypothetical protein D8B20_19420 [Pantoea soli]
MESSDTDHHSNILIGKAAVALFQSGEDVNRDALLKKLHELADSTASQPAFLLAVAKLTPGQPTEN